MSRFPIRRDQLPPGEVLCAYCTGLCCRYFTVALDTPTNWNDFDNIRWYMMHGRVSAYVDEGAWYLCVAADCRHLLPDNRCGVYEDRPQICRDYKTSGCEYDDRGVHERNFDTPEQIWEYAEAILPPRRPAPRSKKTGRNGTGRNGAARNGTVRNGAVQHGTVQNDTVRHPQLPVLA